MKRTFVVIISAVLLILFSGCLFGCQATPENPILVEKDSERLIEQAGKKDNGVSLSDMLALENNYQFNYMSQNGKLQIHADAFVVLPGAEAMPIFRIVATGFSQEFAKKAFCFLFPDPNNRPNNVTSGKVATKADLEKRLIELKKQLADGTYNSDEYSEADWQRLIEVTEEMLKDAPETGENIPETVADGTMKLVDNGKYSYYELACMDSATLDRQFSVVSYDVLPSSLDYDDALGTTSKMRFIKDAEWQYEGQDELTITQGSLSDHTTEKLLVGLEDAKMLCERFFSAVEMEDFYEISEITLIKKTDDQYAVKLYYRQVVDGVPTFACTRDYYGTQDLYARPWGYEFVSFIVSENGIDAIKWIEPVQVVETVTPDAQLLTLEQVTPIFEKMLITRLEPRLEIYTDPIELDCDVSSVALELVRIKEHNVIGKEGLLVPAWVFYGHLTQRTMYTSGTVYTYDMIGNVGSSVLGPPAVIMAINAIDGSVIDLEMGY
jgi:hypothetical protein